MPGDSWVHIVDDDEAVRDSLVFLFESFDLRARAYQSAMAFLEVVEGVDKGCVVTDVRMLRELRSQQLGLPVIVITGRGDVPPAHEAVVVGAFDLFEKPVSEEGLLNSVRRAMASSGGELAVDEAAAFRAK